MQMLQGVRTLQIVDKGRSDRRQTVELARREASHSKLWKTRCSFVGYQQRTGSERGHLASGLLTKGELFLSLGRCCWKFYFPCTCVTGGQPSLTCSMASENNPCQRPTAAHKSPRHKWPERQPYIPCEGPGVWENSQMKEFTTVPRYLSRTHTAAKRWLYVVFKVWGKMMLDFNAWRFWKSPIALIAVQY